MGYPQLTIDMKSSIALMAAWIVYLVASITLSLATGPFDVYAAGSMFFAVPYLVFIYFGLKGKPWAFLWSSIISSALIVVIAFTIQADMPMFLVWLTVLATVLLALMAMEGFKGSLQSVAADTRSVATT